MAKNNIKFNIPNITNEYPQSASVFSKLLKSEGTIKYNPANLNFQDISNFTKEKVGNNDDILELFPDVELAIQILTSSILAPNDMVNIMLQYIPPKIALPSSVKQTLIDTIRQYMDTNYNLTAKLPVILREAMFTKGAYIEAVIPEASLDDIVNQTNYNNITLESYIDRTMGNNNYLGRDNTSYFITKEERGGLARVNYSKPESSKAAEITQEDLCIQITDNPNVLLFSRKRLKQAEEASAKVSSKALNFSTESEEQELDRIFKSDSKLLFRDYISVPQANDASRESIGSPLVIKLPVESVIPVHATSDASKHLGYFIILDENGNPLVVKDGLANYQDAISNMTFLNNSNASGLLSKAKLALQGVTKDTPQLQELEAVYNQVVETMIKNRLKNGMFQELAELNDNADIYKVMLGRSLKAQQTKVLFLPAELVTYYAFEYRENGTGKSLLEKNLLLYSMRAMLLFARLMASIKNSINTTVVSATLDEHDPDPETSREKIISESLKTRQSTIPLGLIRPDDLTEWTHRVGFMYKINHPALPNIELDVSDQAPSKVMPDDELDNKLAERILMSFGLTPEIVMAGYSSDFATTVASRNLLFAKRCTATQLLLIPQITKHIRMIARNDFVLVEKLREIIKTNIKDIKSAISKSDTEEDEVNLKKISETKLIDYLVKEYINNTEVKLPDIVLIDAAAGKNAYEEFKNNCDTFMDDIFTSTVFNDKYAGKLNEEIDGYKDIWKAMARIKWASENNFLPEVTSMFVRDDEGKPEFDIFGQYINYKESIIDLATTFTKQATKSRGKTDKALNKVLEALNEITAEGGGDSGGGEQPQDQNVEGGDQGGEGGAPEGGDTGGGESGGNETGGNESGGSDDSGGGDSDFGDFDMGSIDKAASEATGNEGGSDQNESSGGTNDTEESTSGNEEPKQEEPKEQEQPQEEKQEEQPKEEPVKEEENKQEEEPKEQPKEDEQPKEEEKQEEPKEEETPKEDNKEQEDKQKEKEEADKKKKEEEEKKKKEEEEKKKKDQQAEEAYQLDFARTKM